MTLLRACHRMWLARRKLSTTTLAIVGHPAPANCIMASAHVPLLCRWDRICRRQQSPVKSIMQRLAGLRCNVRCRCVVMMGMPFPNPTDAELCERMRYLDAGASAPADSAQPAGQQHTPERHAVTCLALKLPFEECNIPRRPFE